MIKSSILSVLLAASFLGGCENMTTGQKGALTGAAPASARSPEPAFRWWWGRA